MLVMVIAAQETEMDEEKKPHPLREWMPDPIPRREPPVAVELEKIVAAAEQLLAALRELQRRLNGAK